MEKNETAQVCESLVGGFPLGELCPRVQKITEALYRVTDLFLDKEPLKWQLRENAIELLDLLSSKESAGIFETENTLCLIKKINRLLQLAYESSAFVSSINFEVLRREYLVVNDIIENQVKNRKSYLPERLYNGQVSNHNGHKGQDDNVFNGQEKKEKIEIIIDKLNNENNKDNNGQPQQPIVLKERKRKILSLIRSNEWLSIRDICVSLPEFGEKSIQRDLIEMTDTGILKKAGDKRWRKYSLV